jgi:hypothetical protein
MLSAEHWKDFLENGYLELHPGDGAGFCFERLTREQMARAIDRSARFDRVGALP